MDSSIKYYPLTHPQKGIWYTEKLYPGTSIASISATLRLKDDVDYSILEKAINLFIEKNDGVRLRFNEYSNEPRQYVSGYNYVKLDFHDFSKCGLDKLYKWDEEQTRLPFKLIDSDMFYFALIKIDDRDGGFLVKMHHLVSDAWTMSIVGNSIVEYYYMLKDGNPVDIENKPSYIDYIAKEDEYRSSNRFESDRQYWNEKLTNWSEVTSLKVRKSNELSSRARRKTFLIPKKLSGKIHEYCSEKGFSEYVLFFAALSMYINRVSAKEDIILGTTLLNRSNVKDKNTVGMFTSSAVPTRISISSEMNFRTFTEYISKEIMSIMRHQRYPYDLMAKHVREQNKVASAIFDIVLSYQNSKFTNVDENAAQYATRWHFSGYQIESLLININDRDNDGRLIVDYDYLTDLFYATEIDFIHQHIINLLWHALDNPEKSISKLEMLSEQEKHKILHDFNDTKASFDESRTIHELFECQVEKTPDNVAAVFEGNQLTYRELNNKANKFASILRGKGVRSDIAVGILCEKSLDTIILTLAVLKAGGAYLPLDPEYPEQRLEFMLEDSGTKILLTTREASSGIHFNGERIFIEDQILDNTDTKNMENINTPRDMIYIIYTSGSSGKPKGVMVEHRNVNRLLKNDSFQFEFNENDVWTMFHSYCFDFSVWEIYGALLYGGKLVIIPKKISRDTKSFLKLMKYYGVTVLNQTPAAFYNLINEEMTIKNSLLKLRYVIFGGDALRPALLKPFHEKYPDTALINMYGITETTVHVTFKELMEEDLNSGKSNIGKPIPTLKTFILDKNMNLLPINIPGEICVGGEGVARGYLNRPELTNEKFIDNPYCPGEKLYRSGDLGRWFSKGDIEYLGRMDKQVKIRGFRIETGEIESVLNTLPGVYESMITVNRDSFGKDCLCAYFKGDKDISVSSLRSHLQKNLPDYMIPTHFIKVDKFPLNINGKIKMDALPKITESLNVDTAYEPPENEIEIELVKVWAEVLGCEKIGVNDKFFELGGDSLTIVQILTKVFSLNWNLAAADFYKYQTIRELAEKITGYKDNENQENYLKIEDFEGKEQIKIICKKRRYPCNVLLTGATGFLGAHILDTLVEKTNSKIYCLVRENSKSKAESRLKNTLNFYFSKKYSFFPKDRVIVINGDINDKCFGMELKDYEKLGKNINTVIHAAALVKYFGDYSDFFKTNVEGTMQVAEFALENNIKLNHISTIGISGSYLVKQKLVNATITENDFYVGQNFMDNVYVRSKFEAENVIIRMMKQGLNASIFRMGNLTGRYSDGHFQKNADNNAFFNTIKSILQLECIPNDMLDTEIEFTPVDLAACAIVNISDTSESDGRIFHIMNGNELMLSKLLKIFSSIGITINILNREKFMNHMEMVSRDKQKQEILSGIITDFNGNGDLNYKVEVKVNSQITVDYLGLLDFKWPEVDTEYIIRIFRHLKYTGYLALIKSINDSDNLIEEMLV